ncbi:hypothetical protein CRYUN_Cryun24cG0087200 [Craigia yunnanensis]
MAKENKEADKIRWSPKVWKSLWSLKLPLKMIIFLWKICSNSLPVPFVLHRFIPNISPLCPLCPKEDETLEHLFVKCPMARAVWFGG